MDNKKTLPEHKATSSVLITGGYGILGTKLNEIINCHRPTHEQMNIRKNLMDSEYFRSIDPHSIRTVIHCAALKNERCTNSPIDALLTNIIGTANVALFCESVGANLVYISTDYVFRGDRGNYKPTDEVGPANYYGETKLAGEYVAKSLKEHLIVRLSFFPDVFPYGKAFVDQFTTRITATQAAQKIVELIECKARGIQHVFGPKRSVYEYALETAGGKYIEPIFMSEDHLQRPRDTSLEQ
jgi:dTDP-4-dehydrorhamnose reductase